MSRFHVLCLFGFLGFALSLSSTAGGTGTTVISNDNMGSWGFFEEIPNGTGQLIDSVVIPPLGTGSANMTIDATGRMLFGTFGFAGTFLADMFYLEYSTYQNPLSTASTSAAISLQFNMDYDLNDGDTSWQGRLVFEPANNPGQGAVTKGVWQTWNPHLGNWWMTGTPVVGDAPVPNQFPQSAPGTFDDIVAAYPNAGLTDFVGALFFKAGGPTPGFDGDVDVFTIMRGIDTCIFDFENMLDSDGDGVPDFEDDCPNSDTGVTVVIGDCDSGVENISLGDGCTLADVVNQLLNDSGNYGQFVSALSLAVKKTGVLSGKEFGRIVSCAARSK